MKYTTQKIIDMLTDCDDVKTVSNCPFSKWELDFLESIEEQYDESGSLSEKQEAILKRLWDKI